MRPIELHHDIDADLAWVTEGFLDDDEIAAPAEPERHLVPVPRRAVGRPVLTLVR
ncbi:hypothetical protein [Curtobacterium sp. ISL-83]|uniref:hypothetical protein n=1 Tax=Curtobacterium sp. ISL-83 TaxID=2819145 RepID=UPI001BE89E89|nr:hypothetical protein [Curtobacterium sp. ISL-83]MBT2503559.1 hypothetical protein [Curtobacterium sp. ISL-83]